MDNETLTCLPENVVGNGCPEKALDIRNFEGASTGNLFKGNLLLKPNGMGYFEPVNCLKCYTNIGLWLLD